MRYATRNHALVPATTWVLDGGVLRQEDDKGPPREIPLDRVRVLRLDFAPTRPERNRYRCRLELAGGETLTIFNRTYVSFGNFADTSADYVAFVQALIAALRQHAPRCEWIAGASAASYFFNLLATGFIFGCFGLISFFLFSVGLTWLIVLKILLLLFYVPVLLRWVMRNRPRAFSPKLIPPDMLPATAKR